VLSPMTTVFVLAVLWLIVVVPMVVRRKDGRRRERSVNGFGRSMRALGRPAVSNSAGSRTDIFVAPRARTTEPVTAARRPVPAAQEALMYPVDRAELSEARQQMMRRRRRSLTILTLGSIVLGLAAFVMGGALWLLAAPFMIGLVGYLWFLRSQAMRDRERRAGRQRRASERHSHGFDATEEIARFEHSPATMVRIDDDDLELHNLDTVDLTGLYHEEADEVAVQRRAS
jgi:hypothetical protein